MGTRVRSRSQDVLWTYNVDGQDFRPSSRLPQSTTAITLPSSANGSITDVAGLTPVQSRQRYNTVTHVKNWPAIIDDSVSQVYLINNKTYVKTVDIKIGLKYNPTLPTLSFDWGGMFDELAGVLVGRIKNPNMVLVTLKEMSSTVSMFKNPFNLMKLDWRTVAKNHSASTLAKTSANVWLEHLYGWKSFLTDVTTFSEACGKSIIEINDQVLAEEDSNRFSAKRVLTGTQAVPAYVGSLANDGSWNANLTAIYGRSKQTAHALRVKPARAVGTAILSCHAKGAPTIANQRIRKLLGNFDIVNWRSLRDCLWEVVPYSFVVDWFVDMRGLWAPYNKWTIASLASSHLGYSTKWEVEYQAEWQLGYSDTYYSNLIYRYNRPIVNGMDPLVITSAVPGKYTRYVREPGLPSGEVPEIKFLGKGLSTTQCLSGISLLTQRILK